MKYVTLVAATLLSFAAVAHHGWSWAEEEQSELIGKIASISMSPPVRFKPLTIEIPVPVNWKLIEPVVCGPATVLAKTNAEPPL